MPTIDYQRVTRRRRTPAGSSELWLASDHLLLVTRQWATENYQRFRLSEIKSIVAVERPSLRPIQMVGLVAAALLCALAIFGQAGTARRLLIGAPLALAFVWLLVDFLRGPYCRVELTTAVSSVRLTPLRRMRAAMAFIDTVTPLIEAAQSQWGPAPPPLETGWTMSGASGSVVPPPLPQLNIAYMTLGEYLKASGSAVPPPLPQPSHAIKAEAAEAILFTSTLMLGFYELVSGLVAVPQAINALAWTLATIPPILGTTLAFRSPGAAVRVLAGSTAVTTGTLLIASFVASFSAITTAAGQGPDAAAIGRLTGLWLHRLFANAIRPSLAEPLGIVLVAIGLIGLTLVVLRRRPESN